MNRTLQNKKTKINSNQSELGSINFIKYKYILCIWIKLI